MEIATNDFDIFAKTPPDSRAPRGWLVDLLNKYVAYDKLILLNHMVILYFYNVIFFRFGVLGGFQKLSDRFESNNTLTVSIISGLIRPFGSCSELLTETTITKYFMPIVVCKLLKYIFNLI